MNTHLGYYSYHHLFYTGTTVQPDVLHVFIKPEKDSENFSGYNHVPLATWIGLAPVASCVSGAIRIKKSIKVIFKELSHLELLKEEAHKATLWNAFKNLGRGIVEVIPLTGIFLIVFESARVVFYCAKIKKEIEEEENIAGIAIDGKVVFTTPIENTDPLIKDGVKSPEKRLFAFNYLSLEWLKRVKEKQQYKAEMKEIFEKLQQKMEGVVQEPI